MRIFLALFLLLMATHLHTNRLILRDIESTDAPALFAMDSNAEVMKFLGKPVQSLEESEQMIQYIQAQYVRNGIGRWAVEHQETGEFMGWCGIKYVDDRIFNEQTNFHDLGYRFLPAYWQQGYAFEAAEACCTYAFEVMKLSTLVGMADVANTGSCRIMEKLGFRLMEDFYFEGQKHHWFEKSL